MTLHTYLPQDRLRALARGETLPDRTSGSALFADISGFTALTEGLRESLGLAQRLGALRWVVVAVGTFALLAHAEGQTERALALFGMGRQHPAWNSEYQRQLDNTLAEWALDPSVVEAGLKKGEELDWEETVKELLEK